MAHNRGYISKMKFKNYDMQKRNKKERNIYEERKVNEMIKLWKIEVEEMKLEMEMY